MGGRGRIRWGFGGFCLLLGVVGGRRLVFVFFLLEFWWGVQEFVGLVRFSCFEFRWAGFARLWNTAFAM